MKRLDIDRRASVLLPAINAHRSGVAEFNRDDPRRFVGAEKEFVILEGHPANSPTSLQMTKR